MCLRLRASIGILRGFKSLGCVDSRLMGLYKISERWLTLLVFVYSMSKFEIPLVLCSGYVGMCYSIIKVAVFIREIYVLIWETRTLSSSSACWRKHTSCSIR